MRPLGIHDPAVALAGTLVLWCLGLWLGTELREELRNGRPSRR